MEGIDTMSKTGIGLAYEANGSLNQFSPRENALAMTTEVWSSRCRTIAQAYMGLMEGDDPHNHVLELLKDLGWIDEDGFPTEKLYE